MATKRVLIIYRSYFPSVSHLGPATAIRNLTENMGADYAFHLLTLNYGFANGSQLLGNKDRFDASDRLTVEYVPRGIRGLVQLFRRLRDEFDIVEIHCAFDPLLAIPALIMCRLGLARTNQVLHTPHGIFMDVITSVRQWRKRLFFYFADVTNLFKGVIHLAASPAEARDISNAFKRRQDIVITSQFVTVAPMTSILSPRQKSPGSLRIAIVGRVAAQKNLLFAIDIAQRLELKVTLDIFGAITEQPYYERCKGMIGDGDDKCTITFHGHLDKDVMLSVLPTYDVLLHPSLGENFGHAIVEAMTLGVPVLLSDQCPWIDVKDWNAGWSVPLSHPEDFMKRLAQLHAMGNEWQQLHQGALSYARHTFNNSATAARYRRVYEGSAHDAPIGIHDI
jgi:glycosyltransferase involved in cell wall biosynthesis